MNGAASEASAGPDLGAPAAARLRRVPERDREPRPEPGPEARAGDRPTTPPARGGGLVAAPAGVLAGVVGSFLQAWAPASVPVGLLLALAALGVALALGVRLDGTVGVTAAAAGWALAVLVLLWPRREGDVVLAATAEAYTYLFCGVLLCAVGLVAGRRRDSRNRDSRTAAGPPMQDE